VIPLGRNANNAMAHAPGRTPHGGDEMRWLCLNR
jgi:hypothetical protein